MSFRPKYVPYDEARRAVAERLGLAPNAYNPISAALNEGALLPEVWRDGAWMKLAAGEWQKISIWRPHPYVYPSDPPEDWQTLASDIQIELARIDELWPPPGVQQIAATGQPKSPKRPRGLKPVQFLRVVGEMEANDQRSRLGEMTEAEMETRFRASRDTCRRARNKVLEQED